MNSWLAGILGAAATGGATLSGLELLASYARRRYAVPRAPDDVLTARTADGWDLRVLQYRAQGPQAYAEPVVLCHGLAANSYNLDLGERYSLARSLAARGFDVFVPDLRGREGSWPSRARWHERHEYTFDHHAAFDAPAIVAAALQRTGARRTFWVGHSMGGMVGYVLAGREQERLAGLVTIASPARMKVDRLLTRLVGAMLALPLDPLPQRFFAQAMAPIAGHRFPPLAEFSAIRENMDIEVIRQALSNVIVDMPRRLLKQFVDWAVLEHPISAHGGIDYRESMSRVRAPLLCLASSGDKLAPPQDVRPGHDLVRSSDRTFIDVGSGGPGDPAPGRTFGHNDLVLGRDAPELLYPLIGRWLGSRATALRKRRAV